MVERFNGRIAHLLKTTYFAHADERVDTLASYQNIYNHHLIQRNLGYITLVQALKAWCKEKPDLFNKSVYEQADL